MTHPELLPLPVAVRRLWAVVRRAFDPPVPAAERAVRETRDAVRWVVRGGDGRLAAADRYG